MSTKKNIIKTLIYFDQFGYLPTTKELYLFLECNLSYKDFESEAQSMIGKSVKFENERWSLINSSGSYKGCKLRVQYSTQKMKIAREYVERLKKWFPILLIGVSGSVAVNNAKKCDDIDVFIISRANMLWVTRLIAILNAKYMRRHRTKSSIDTRDKLCLNLFFSASQLSVPKEKQTYFVAHEVLQMKHLYDVEGTYASFIKANEWVFGFFPNARSVVGEGGAVGGETNHASVAQQNIKELSTKKWLQKIIFCSINIIVRPIQLSVISKTLTTERVSDTQLWFFPDDFEKKIKM